MSRRRSLSKPRQKQTRRLRVGIYITSIHCGGVERWAATLASEFSNCHFTGFLSRWPGTCESWMPGRIYTYEEYPEFFSNCDVILSWFFAEDDVALLSKFDGRLYAVSHGSHEHPWFRSQARFMLNVPGIQPVGVSHAAAKAFGLDVPVPVIYNGVELDRSITSPDPELRHAMGLDNKKVILYYGRLSSEKRPHYVANMMKYLDPDKYATIICGGNTGNFASVMPRLKGVHLLKPTRNPRSLFSVADCSVNFSETESFCLSLFESMAARVPTISSQWEVTPELESVLGEPLITTPLHAAPDELASVVAYHLNNPDKDRDTRLRERVFERLSAGKMAREWERLLGVEPLAEFSLYDETSPHDCSNY